MRILHKKTKRKNLGKRNKARITKARTKVRTKARTKTRKYKNQKGGFSFTLGNTFIDGITGLVSGPYDILMGNDYTP